MSVLLAACVGTSSEAAREAQTTDALAIVATADRYDTSDRRFVDVYAKIGELLVRLANDSAALPADASWQVSIVRDSAARPLRVDLSPIDPGGDGAVTYSYFLDSAARVRVVDVRGAFLHTDCADLLKVNRRVVYDRRGDSLSGDERLTDGGGHTKTPTECLPLPGAMSPPTYRTFPELVRAGLVPSAWRR